MDNPSVTIRIITFKAGYYWGANKPFTILEFDDAAPLIYVEHRSNAEYPSEDDDGDPQVYFEAFAESATLALTPEKSRELVTEALRELG
jgi:hypothetical protein